MVIIFGIISDNFLFFLINGNIHHVLNWRAYLVKFFSKFKLIQVSSSWKSTHYQDQHGCFHVFIPPNIGFSFSFFLATNVLLFLIKFHYYFILLDTDATLHIASKVISPIPKLFHTQPVFSVLWKKEFSKVTLKQQTDYYLINYLFPNLITKHYFYFTFTFFDLSQMKVFRLWLQTMRLLYGFFQTKKTVSPNGHFSNGKRYQVAHQPLVFQIYIQVTLYDLLL